MILLIPFIMLVAIGVILKAVAVDTLLICLLVSGWYLDWHYDMRAHRDD